MKTVIAIHEENHGFIGVAANMDAALRFLIEENWIDELWDNMKQTYVHHKKLYHRHNVDNLFDLLSAMYRTDDNAFDGMFYFSERELFE